MSVLDKIKSLTKSNKTNFASLVWNQLEAGQLEVGQLEVGQVRLDRLHLIAQFEHIFKIGEPTSANEVIIYFTDYFLNSSVAKRNDLIADFCNTLKTNKHVTGWRDELYPVFDAPKFDDANLLFVIERACVAFLGLPAYGIHVNGYVNIAGIADISDISDISDIEDIENNIKVWIAKRSMSRAICPGCLDQIAAGGLPAHLNMFDNMQKECNEEASIPAYLSKKAKFIHTLHYINEDPRGLKFDYLHVFDLELPADFIPQVNDGEAQSFQLLDLTQITKFVSSTDQFKPNCGLVMIDFLIRNRKLESFAEYRQLIMRP